MSNQRMRKVPYLTGLLTKGAADPAIVEQKIENLRGQNRYGSKRINSSRKIKGDPLISPSDLQRFKLRDYSNKYINRSKTFLANGAYLYFVSIQIPLESVYNDHSHGHALIDIYKQIIIECKEYYKISVYYFHLYKGNYLKIKSIFLVDHRYEFDFMGKLNDINSRYNNYCEESITYELRDQTIQSLVTAMDEVCHYNRKDEADKIGLADNQTRAKAIARTICDLNVCGAHPRGPSKPRLSPIPNLAAL